MVHLIIFRFIKNGNTYFIFENVIADKINMKDIQINAIKYEPVISSQPFVKQLYCWLN